MKKHGLLGCVCILFAALVCLSGCVPAGGEVTDIQEPAAPVQTDGAQTPAPDVVPEPTTDAEPGISAEARDAYRAALQRLLDEKILPDGSDAGYDGVYPMSDNHFAVTDVDGDGADELIIAYTTTASAGQIQAIYGYDADTQKLRAELVEYPMLTFFDNGVIKAGWSHNQGLGGDFWPYNLYKYSAETDSYEMAAMVDAWDKNYFPEDFSGQPFPDEVDTSGAGFVYYIMPGGEYIETDPVDSSAYSEWYDSYLAGAQELILGFLDLTNENIAALG